MGNSSATSLLRECGRNGGSPDLQSSSRCNAEIARRLYREAPLLRRLLFRWRPYICPFEVMMSQVPDGSRVLDIGCGGGLFLGLLAATRRGIRGLGADVSRPALEVARCMAQAAMKHGSDAKLDFALVDVTLELPEGFFDIVSIIDVAHHLTPDRVLPVLRAAAKRVSGNGLLIYKDMAARPRWKAAVNRIHDLMVAKQWISYIPVAAIEEAVCECGLDVAHSETLDRAVYRHELRVFRRVSGHGTTSR